MSWLDTLEDIRKKDFAKVPMKDRDKAARDVINMASYGCAVVAVSPMPFSDVVLSLPMQSAMVMTVGHIYGRKVTQADAKDLVLELGTVVGAGMLARQGIKALLPVVGALLTVPAAFAMNWGIGRVAMEYFKNPGLPKDQLQKVFDAAKKEGRSLFSKERFDAFLKSRQAKTPDAESDDGAEPKKKPAAKKKRSGAAKLLHDEFEPKIAAHPEVRSAFAGLIHLDLSGADGGLFTADLTRSEGFISEGLSGKPKLTVRCSAKDFAALVKGRKNAQMAVLAGDLELEPMNLDLVATLAPLFA
ncbi:MAG: DUF697 domain-containing protein [Myxococcaceae bacterium]|nr:DUF697 domain-containing protein [Myxococcaceae bacterium]